MSFSYANPTSGPSAGGIGWLDFGNLTLNPGDSVTGLGGTLQDGTTVTFDLSYNYVSGQPRTFVAVPTPVFSGCPFGGVGYTGINGNVALWSDFNFAGTGVNAFTISNIVVKDTLDNPISNYTVVVADSETTNIQEVWDWSTNGGVWTFLALLGQFPPVITGIGTQSVNISSNTVFPEVTQAAYILTTQSPTQLYLSSTESQSGRQAFSIGFAITKLTLQKNIGQRIDANDQFVLDISGTPSATATTNGNTNGIQLPNASIYAIQGSTYTLTEAMAIASTSALHDYTQILSASNTTPNGTIPPIGSFPLNVTLALGDEIVYTIVNAAPEVFTKTVDKAYADVGEILTYQVSVENPNDFAITNVQFQDATPAGTIYIGNLVVNVPFTGSDPASGLILASVAANATATISWQVQVNTFPPIPNPVPNYANIIVPQGTSGMSNVVTTQVNMAFVSIIKTVDKAYATVNDILTYTFTLHNAGNVPADHVVLQDSIPFGTTFVPGSLINATGTPPTFTLLGSIPSMGDATVQFQVQVDEVIPAINPIQNSASIQYDYTVDPAQPDGASGSTTSNIVSTLVNEANIQIEKFVDTAYAGVNDTLTYSFLLTNTENVEANNVVVQDVLPSGISYIPGTLQGATGTPDHMLVTTPIPAQTSTILSFQVQVDGAIPPQNPIVNNAVVTYTFTINPMDPNGESRSKESNDVITRIVEAKLSIIKEVDKAYADVDEVLTYTITIQNIGNTNANVIELQDIIPNGTTFINGSLFGAIGTSPLFVLTTSLAPNETHTITFQVLIGSTIPNPNPLVNDALVSYTYTIDPNNPNGASGNNLSNEVSTLVSNATVTTLKTVDQAFAKVGDILTYTLALYNSGNTLANHVVIQDVLPTETSFIAGSLQGASGTPPTLTLTNSIGAQSFAYVSFQVRVDAVPTSNQLINQALITYSYTSDPTLPDNHHKTTPSNPVETQIHQANVTIKKSVDKTISYINDIVTYMLVLENTGNVDANTVVLQDVLANGLQYVANSLQASAPVVVALPSITLTQPLQPNASVVIQFQAKVIAFPNPNPIKNVASVQYTYEVDPNQPPIPVQRFSDPVFTLVFRNRYPQQITDIIKSVAHEEAALAAIINAEGAKIQEALTLSSITPQELLCINKSVEDLLASISLLEMILKQKVDIVSCQIDGEC